MVLTGLVSQLANRESVSLFDANGVPKGAIPDAKRLGPGLRERTPSDGEYLATEVCFMLPAIQFAGGVKPGYTLMDAARIVYVVQQVSPPVSFTANWKCRCLALMALGNTITWKIPTNSSDSFASPLITQNASLGPYPAAIREELRQEVVFQGAVRGFRRHFSIWTVQDSPLSKGTLGVDQNGLVYTVDRIVNRKRIDELPQTLCVIEP